MLTVYALVCVAVPWIVLAVSVARRIRAGRDLQTWQYETAVIGVLGAVVTSRVDPTWSGWAGYGAALLAHGASSIRARVGDAYTALRDYVRRHAPDTALLHAVECLSRLRYYVWGATAIALATALLRGAAVAAIAQWATSEAYSRWRRWWVARRARPPMTWRLAVVGLVRGDVDPEAT